MPRPQNVQKFIDDFGFDAKLVSQSWRIPASVIIAQAGLETGWGASVRGNAFFNIKGKSASGKSVTVNTVEVVKGRKVRKKATFRTYDSFIQAAHAYARFITETPPFSDAVRNLRGIYDGGDPYAFVDAIAGAGYATDPDYASKLREIIKNFDLEELDKGYAV